MSFRASDLSWTRVQALARSGAVALVPVGSTEAHGPHLPLSVDVLIAEAVCARAVAKLAARKVGSVVFPAVSYGLTDFAAAFAGTVSVSREATQAYLTDVFCGIARHGFKRVVAVNHHLEPAHFKVVHQAARDAASKTGATVLVPDHRKPPLSDGLGEEFLHGGSHAGQYETSLVLAIAPNLVDEAARRTLPELAVDLPARIKAGARDFLSCGGPLAYFGAPARATQAEGERLLDLLSDAVANAI